MNSFNYGKREANLIKGIAIILMLVHHLFGFPEWIDDGNMYTGITVHGIVLEQAFAEFCKICVGLYAFTTGYAIFVNHKQYAKWSGRLHKMLKFLLQYWVVMVLFLIAGVLLKEPLPTFQIFILQCFGIHTATGFAWSSYAGIHPGFAWYVTFYLLFLLLSPLLCKLSKVNFWLDFIIYAVFFYGIHYIFVERELLPLRSGVIEIISSFAIWGFIGMTGYLFAKYQMFSKTDLLIRRFMKSGGVPVGISIAVVVSVFICRHYAGTYLGRSASLDVLWTPVMIYALITIINYIHSRVFEKGLFVIAKYSMNIWFLQGIFFTPNRTLQWLAYWPKYPVLIFIWTLILMLFCAIPVSRLQSFLMKKGKQAVRRINIQNGC